MGKEQTVHSTRENLKHILSFKKWIISVLIHIFLVLIVIIISPFFGIKILSFSDLSNNPILRDIFFSYRLPRVLSAFILGGTLSLSGAVLQATLKNPLIEPYTLGISSIAALGAFIGSNFIFFIPFSEFSTSLLLSIICIFFLYGLSQRKGYFSIYDLILSGITISIFAASLISLFRYFLNPFTASLIDRWLVGSIAASTWKDFYILILFAAPLLTFSIIFINDYNQLYFNREICLSRGIDIGKLQKFTFLFASIATAGAVSLFGPIGFVGLIIPHIERKISGYDYRLLLPNSFLTGGIFLVLSDAISRLLIPPSEIPVGIITAFLGAPFFIYLLFFRKELTSSIGKYK